MVSGIVTWWLNCFPVLLKVMDSVPVWGKIYMLILKSWVFPSWCRSDVMFDCRPLVSVSHFYMLLYHHTCVTRSSVCCFDRPSHLLCAQNLSGALIAAVICLDMSGQFFYENKEMGTRIGQWGNWQSMKAIFIDTRKLAAFIEFGGVYRSWSLLALLAWL